ncbi:MAG: gamma-glutamylcyclotransferase [Roseiarcus sp.]|jgi:cation transport protein ChaC
MTARAAQARRDLWVFGYGSLMWRPGFVYAERHKALLRGWRRRLCIYSHVYRGTADRPGLVLGLDRGGACHGVAFRVEGSRREATVRYLRERELVAAVYLERTVPVTLSDGRRVAALTYVADRAHGQYAGPMPPDSLLRLVRQGVGQSGDNAEYVLATRDHLRELGILDGELEWLAAQLRTA